MCGIAGYYSIKNVFKSGELKIMTNKLSHRGPDAEGHFEFEAVALGHKRLSIIDLSKEANQPMQSHCGGYTIVFNGEIYNYKEIAKELSIKPKTSSDTEILLEAFVKLGPDFVKKLNGMFAIAIYNHKSKELFLFRDRIGIKPLYYYLKDNQLAFASELKALLSLDYINKGKDINSMAVRSFLQLGYIPEPESIYSNIKKLPKGHYASFNGQDLRLSAYWKLSTKIENGVIFDEQDAKEQLTELIKDSVKYRLIADVPYGTFLSGGVDSSLVSAVAQKTTNQQLKTFSIGFEDEKFNETTYARQVANHIESDHHEFILTEQDALNHVPNIFKYYDEPYADSSAIPTMLVSKMARQHVTMTLSGDGGDELFHGYGSYLWANRLNKPLAHLSRKAVKGIFNKGSSRFKRIGYLFDYEKKESLKPHIFSQEQYFFSQKELSKLVNKEYESQILLNDDYSDLLRPLNPAEQQALFDLHYYLPDDLLTKVDRASMRYSLETRVPLLDHRIVEFALNLDSDLKIKNGEAKYLLKQVLYDYVPKSIFDRPKWGFGIPLVKWLKTDLKFLIEDYLSEEIIKDAGFVNYRIVEKLIRRFNSNNEDYLYNRIWVLICLHRWYVDVYKN